jgi:multidrug efflux system outer membrane protein
VVFDLERLIAMKENELSVLLGRSPGAIVRGRPLEEQRRPGEVPAGLPAELLDRRPDIRVAEQNLAAATANIGEAKALLFPRVALTGSFGLASTELDNFFDSTSWNLLGNLLQPIFNAGQNKRRVEIAESRQRQMLYDYHRTILLAFQETEDALVAYRKTGELHQAQTARVVAVRKVLDLSETRYRGGVTAYLEVLDAQRSLFGAELDEAEAFGSHLVWLVRLYKALGGGWPAAAEPPAEETPAEQPSAAGQ